MSIVSTPFTGVSLADQTLFRQSCYVDGAWTQSRSGATTTVDNPATGAAIGQVPSFGAAETRDAIEAAERAFRSWRARPAKARAAILRKWSELVLAHQEDLAQLITTEQGKPIRESRAE